MSPREKKLKSFTEKKIISESFFDTWYLPCVKNQIEFLGKRKSIFINLSSNTNQFFLILHPPPPNKSFAALLDICIGFLRKSNETTPIYLKFILSQRNKIKKFQRKRKSLWEFLWYMIIFLHEKSIWKFFGKKQKVFYYISLGDNIFQIYWCFFLWF